MERLTWEEVRAWRLARQHLVERLPARKMLDAVKDVCGVHWERRSLVRTWCMRGTLHLLRTDDLPLYVAALRTHDRWWKGAWLRMIGFSAVELRAILEMLKPAAFEGSLISGPPKGQSVTFLRPDRCLGE